MVRERREVERRGKREEEEGKDEKAKKVFFK